MQFGDGRVEEWFVENPSSLQLDLKQGSSVNGLVFPAVLLSDQGKSCSHSGLEILDSHHFRSEYNGMLKSF